MQAVILAAGIGRRMRPISEACHKALLPIAGSTILARLVDELLAIDIGRIAVVTGYRADDVRSYLGERYPEVRFTFIANDRFAETNNIVSLSLALDRLALDEDVLLLECDLILAAGTLRRLCGADRGNIALVDRYRAGMDGTVEIRQDKGAGLVP